MTKPNFDAELRDNAEKRLQASAPVSLGTDVDNTPRLTHELQVHQIELEMQNRELQETRLDLEEALALYTELYDFAPVGYLTLNSEGLISRINITGAKLLGVERASLLQKRFLISNERQQLE
jgi:PAS domain-containing protein